MFRIFLSLFFFCIVKMHHLDATAYAQLSSLTSQVPTLSGPAFVKIDSVDAALNIDLSPDKQYIIIQEEGIYFIISAAQIGSVGQTSTGYIDIWLALNEKSMPNSNCRMTIDHPTTTGVLVSQGVANLKKGDRIATRYTASGPSLGIIFSQPDNEPAIPSIIFSIFKISPL